ncbi:MAG: 2-isopropylmalate synthase [bacterium]|nr:2-isopropylmalate synthase [bacterium]
MPFDRARLIYDWNTAASAEPGPARGKVELNDETLRDGLQSPSVRDPSLEQKLAILHKMSGLGIESANIGLPGAGPHVVESVRRLAHEIVDHDLEIAPNCAARTLARDIEPILQISQDTGLEIEVACFIGSSAIRRFTESWEMDRLLELAENAVGLTVAHQLPCMFVTEDTTRAAPEDLRRLYQAAVRAGARRVCVADTVGHATPRGAREVVGFIRSVVDEVAPDVKVDWHGHRDRGLALENSIVAAQAGADRLHGTALGVGERVGNTPIDLLLVNLKLLGWIDRDLTSLPEYCRLVSKATGVPLPENYPIVGRDAFRTGTGVHAAAIIKAQAKGDAELADCVYSGVPAAWVGRRQRIEIGPMSGMSNVVFWLEQRGYHPSDGLVEAIFRCAKAAGTVLEEDEIVAICDDCGAQRA